MEWYYILIIVLSSVLVWFLLSILLYRVFFKRFYDVLFAIIALIPFSLLFIVFAPIIYFSDKGPVFYKGVRLGKNGKGFKMFKFRSMKVNAPDLRNEDGTTYNSENDPRVTKIGRFLRKTSLDEIPQILNIIKGDMSWIGPRPDLMEATEKMTDEQKGKLKVLPGITGYSQVYYRNASSLEQRFNGDLYYAEHLSFFFDIKLIFMTFWTVIRRKNVYRNKD